jgi:hypothetical protein
MVVKKNYRYTKPRGFASQAYRESTAKKCPQGASGCRKSALRHLSSGLRHPSHFNPISQFQSPGRFLMVTAFGTGSSRVGEHLHAGLLEECPLFSDVQPPVGKDPVVRTKLVHPGLFAPGAVKGHPQPHVVGQGSGDAQGPVAGKHDPQRQRALAAEGIGGIAERTGRK